MQAHVDKNEKKGFFGGIKYEFKARIELTAEETKALAGFKLKDASMFARDVDTDRMMKILGADKYGKAYLASQYIKGVTLVFDSVSDISFFEAAFYDGCRNLKAALEGHIANASDIGTSRSMEF